MDGSVSSSSPRGCYLSYPSSLTRPTPVCMRNETIQRHNFHTIGLISQLMKIHNPKIKLHSKKKKNWPIYVWKLTVLGETECVGERIRQSADKEHLLSAKPLTLMNSWTAGSSSQG